MTVFLSFRDGEIEIHYRDHGWEPDANAHEIDWHVVGDQPDPEITEAESEAILEALYEIANDPHNYDPY